ncbi:MAG: T9SS type A sorting domain-containing protein, partial [Bacteroidia bacterium]
AEFCAYKSAVYFNADYSSSTGCEVWKLDTAGATGIQLLSSNQYHVNIYPNPSSGTFNLQISENENTSIEVYNAIGQKVLTQKLQSNVTELNLVDFNSGIYNVRIIKDNELVYQTKMIKL